MVVADPMGRLGGLGHPKDQYFVILVLKIGHFWLGARSWLHRFLANTHAEVCHMHRTNLVRPNKGENVFFVHQFLSRIGKQSKSSSSVPCNNVIGFGIG